MATTILALIIAFLLLDYVIDLILEILNIKNQKDRLPEQLKEFYDEDKYRRSIRYDREKTKLSLISSTLSIVLIMALLFTGAFGWLDAWARTITEHPVAMALLFFGVLYVASDLIGLPFTLYHTFVVEEKYGFNRTTPKVFIGDKLKGYLLTAVLGGGLLVLLIYFYLWVGEWFWIYSWVAVTAITLFFTTFYTAIIVPLFNKLTPLRDGSLRQAIESYSRSVKFPLKNIFVMDGSKRSSKANAYFSGLGGRKSIVLFDTLIEKHTEDELVAVLAHEVGHYKKKHILQSTVISTLQMGIMFFILGLVINQPVLSEALGAEAHSFHLGILAFGLLFSPISMLTGILMSVMSRKNEYEADAYAATTYAATPLQNALKKLSIDNLPNLEPHPLYVFFNYSHPPVLQRLKALDQYKKAGAEETISSS